MLSPEYYESCADDIIKLYEQLENDVISDIIRRMMKTGIVTESAKHQAEVLQNAGLLYDDILRIIARNTDATSQHVRTLFEDASVETVHFDSEIYRENGETPVDIRQSPAMRQTLEAGYRKTLGNMKNLTMTTAVTSQTNFINACNQAYMQVASGAFSYQEAIKQAIKKTAENGAAVLYPSGHQERIDVAVRRAVLTGVGQTCKKIGEMNAEELECDIMEITAHSGARPDHAKWQGQLVSLSGRNAGRVIEGKKVLSLRQIGYGKGDGFGGWNCRHDWFPFFEGYSKPVYSDDDLKQLDEKNIKYNGKKYSQYEISQIQRHYEREIRAAKREQTAFKTAVQEADDPELKQVMQDSLNYTNDVVKRKQAKMRDFISQTGQKRDYFREQNYADKNIGNSLTSAENSGKIRLSEQGGFTKVAITGDIINNVPLITPKGFSAEDAAALQSAHKKLLTEVKKYPVGTECAMLLDLDMDQIDDIIVGKMDTVHLPDCDEYHIALHNHPSGETFSIGDLQKFGRTDNMVALTEIGNNGYPRMLNKATNFNKNGFLKLIKNKCSEPIFDGKSYLEIENDKNYISNLSDEQKNNLIESCMKLSEEIIKEGETYGMEATL